MPLIGPIHVSFLSVAVRAGFVHPGFIERCSSSRLAGGDYTEAKNTEGKFVYVRFKVTNNTSEQQAVLFTPALQDSKGRRFEEFDDTYSYLPEGQNSMTMEQLPAGLPKTFSAFFEIAADADGLLFLTRDLTEWSTTEKGVSLGF